MLRLSNPLNLKHVLKTGEDHGKLFGLKRFTQNGVSCTRTFILNRDLLHDLDKPSHVGRGSNDQRPRINSPENGLAVHCHRGLLLWYQVQCSRRLKAQELLLYENIQLSHWVDLEFGRQSSPR